MRSTPSIYNATTAKACTRNTTITDGRHIHMVKRMIS